MHRDDLPDVVGGRVAPRPPAERLAVEQLVVEQRRLRGRLVGGRRSGGTGSPRSRAQAARTERGSPYRPAWPRSRLSTSSRSWQRATRTPASSSRG
ncbi:hypothetical protein [Actinomadura geliboluensis]|uniref:hypothetical protein n=1 Tax=Actinomadura geliboluensis TaxID=882440 RepID=UPI001F1041C9|nr:hypothetical protein [Actinomadura geliboluensis]